MRWSRLPAVVTVTLAAAAVFAAPAQAHTVTGVQPTNYRSEIVAVTPAEPGVHVELLDLGNRVRVTNSGTVEVTVLGYRSEPYLRIGGNGVYENERSPSVALNRVGATASPSTTAPPADVARPPSWHRISTGDTATWRDRRTRWEGPTPAAVKADTSRSRVVGQWTIVLLRGDQPADVTGRIVWQPPPTAVPWLLGALVVGVATASLGRLRHWGAPLSAVLTIVVATDVVHVIGMGAASGGPARAVVAKVVVGSLLSAVAWAVGACSVPALQRQREGGLFAAGFAAVAVFLSSGLGDVSSLGRAELAYAWAPVTARAAVMVALGAGLGVPAAAAMVLRRNTRAGAEVRTVPPAAG